MPSSLFGNQPQQPQFVNPVQNPQLQAVSQIFNSGGDPRKLIQSMMSARNPQMANVINYVNSMGGDPKAAFYKLAAEKGVDPNAILGMLSRS